MPQHLFEHGPQIPWHVLLETQHHTGLMPLHRKPICKLWIPQ